MQRHLKNDLLYLLRVLEAAEKIKIYSAAFSDPLNFFDANDGLEFNACLTLLTQIGEQTARVSSELQQMYKDVNWREMKGFRNRVVHDYTGLDRFITFDIIKQDIPGLKQAISNIIRKELNAGRFDSKEFSIAKTSMYLRHVDFDSIGPSTS